MDNRYTPVHNLTVCVINYNGERYLEESLGSIFVQKAIFDEILLIDNASQDRSLQIVREKFPAVEPIELDENRGPAMARNVGFKAATNDRILFMDNDVSLAPYCSDRLMHALNENPNVVAVMPRVLYADKKDIIQYDGADNHFLGLTTLHNANKPLNGSSVVTRQIGTIITACFLLDRGRIGLVNPFDESFFIYLEDQDFGLRIRSLGHEILSVQSAHCFHRRGTEGLSIRAIGEYSKMRVFFLIRNRWQLILKNYEFKTLLLLSPMFLIYEVFQIMGVVKKGWIRPWSRAFRWMLPQLFEVRRKRLTVQSKRKTPDRQMLTGGPIPFRDRDLIQSLAERLAKNFLDLIATSYWKAIKRLI